MNQLEIRMFAPFVEAHRLTEAEVEAMSFEQTVEKALESGLKRFDRRTLAKLAGIHYPHFGDLISGRRPFPATKLARFCMLCGCAYPQQWLEIRARRDEEEYRRVSGQAIFDYLQQGIAARAA
ncbi:hypothetical protein LMG7141_00824 [Ralstonia condita]|uniref:XRE family transcriptional regulator n=1 Tax=Ralstonia condita TaxID=3058600 RepID=A0ABM9J137_9RALS|nr:hypothetical protein [Ralstonia sp. LMG 7141]CAJ0778977.1 hypothetical protein LMG7141_00824 [Ralstonia sp. LMG 7141]